MNKVIFCTDQNERTNQRFYADATIVKKLPVVGDIFCHDYKISRICKARMNASQDLEIYNYDIYRIDLKYDPYHDGTLWDISFDEIVFVAVPIEQEANDE